MERYKAAQRLIKLHRYERAAEYLAACFESCEENGDAASCETLLAEMSACFEKAGNFESSITCIRQLLERTTMRGPSRQRAIMHHTLGILCEKNQDVASAETHFRLSMQMAGEIGDLRGQGLSMGMLGQMLVTTGRQADGFVAIARGIDYLQRASAEELERLINHAIELAGEDHRNTLTDAANREIRDADVRLRISEG